MSTYIRRLLIVVAVLALVVIVVVKTRSGPDGPADSKPNTIEKKTYTDAELKDLLLETVNRRWKALDDDDWVTIYSMMRPEMRKDFKLTEFIQGKDMVFYDNYEILDADIQKTEDETSEGKKVVNVGRVKVKYDWGANLDFKIDVGEPVKRGVITLERYVFDEPEGIWYFEAGEHEEAVGEKK